MAKNQDTAFVTVPCVGDDFYKDLLRTAAMKLGVTQSLLVRVAIDALVGGQMAEAASFFGRGEGYIPHSVDEISGLADELAVMDEALVDAAS